MPRVFTLLVALWSVVAAPLVASASSDAESCCGTTAAACCCCDSSEESEGDGVRSERSCPCTAPVEPGAPSPMPAITAQADARGSSDAPALETPSPTASAPVVSGDEQPQISGVPPPRPAMAVLHCTFQL